MGKISPKKRQFKIRKIRQRREKIRKLKEKYLATKSKKKKEEIAEKMRKVSPRSPIEEILGIKKEK